MIIAALLLFAMLVAALVLAMVAWVRSLRITELARRIEHLELALRRTSLEAGRAAPPAGQSTLPPATPPPATTSPEERRWLPAPRESERQPIHWEMLIGRQAMGWVAVVLVIFAAAFFIRYAIDNDWIGPLGQTALAELGGLALVIGGWRYYRRQWRVLSQMMTAAGVIVLYLATYAAFGFYSLLSRELASVFLTLIIVESVLLALRYDWPAIGITAVVGGLLTPVLMVTPHDDYPAFFTYLTVLNLGVVLLRLARPWRAIATVAFVGTQALFWTWYYGNFHPEKLTWALGFQVVVYGLYLAHQIGIHFVPRGRVLWEDLMRLVLEAGCWFTALYVLLRDDSLLRERVDPWMGTVAVAMAALYALLARSLLSLPRRSATQVFAALAIAAGFIALAFPLEADAAWVSLGWAAEGAALWWFGQRISNRPLRAIGGGLAVAAVARLLEHDLPPTIRQPFIPIFNTFALPALGVALCILVAIVSTRHRLRQRSARERELAWASSGAAILLLWFILSLECYDFFEARAHQPDASRARWLWLGQMALSVLWAVLATLVLVVGFRWRLPSLRWLALALYAVTVLKVFFVDMVSLDEIYRIVAFFVLAVFTGLAARAYQRIAPDENQIPEGRTPESDPSGHSVSIGDADE